MNILGREVTREKLLRRVRQELEDRGLLSSAVEISVRAAVQAVAQGSPGPLAVALDGLGRHADPTVPLRDAAQPEGLLAQWADLLASRAVRALAPELLGRQRAFNAQLRDACTLLGAELVRLRAEVEALRAAQTRSARASPTTGTPTSSSAASSSIPGVPSIVPADSVPPVAGPSKRGASKRGASKRGASKPVASKPVASKPVASKPVASKPVASKPAAPKPAAPKSAAPKSAAPKSAAASPAPRKSAPRRR